ncbi:hypothetical protein J4H39_23600 [Vibrio alginolyticus]|uniref:hypothetical protein n=1 Tax=Vibrio alginolyticus TaxID=663 RepID=UPI001BD63D9B|nr:hypothetical protein [Vibrio alginolyticus]MBT0000209.1 hypothetical protein [Vibrio alginolyticus]
MENRIPASIQKDIKILTNLLVGNENSLVNEQDETVELVAYGDSEFGGLIMAFNNSESLICTNGEYDHERFLRLTDHFRTESEHLVGNTHILTTKVTFEGVEPAELALLRNSMELNQEATI